MNTAINVFDVVDVLIEDEKDHTSDAGIDCRWRKFVFVDRKGEQFTVTAFAATGVEDALKLPHEKVAEVAEVAEAQS